MTGGIAAAFYGVPSDLMVKATESLPEDIVQVIETFDTIIHKAIWHRVFLILILE